MSPMTSKPITWTVSFQKLLLSRTYAYCTVPPTHYPDSSVQEIAWPQSSCGDKCPRNNVVFGPLFFDDEDIPRHIREESGELTRVAFIFVASIKHAPAAGCPAYRAFSMAHPPGLGLLLKLPWPDVRGWDVLTILPNMQEYSKASNPRRRGFSIGLMITELAARLGLSPT